MSSTRAISIACLVWLQMSVRRRLREQAPEALWRVEHAETSHAVPGSVR